MPTHAFQRGARRAGPARRVSRRVRRTRARAGPSRPRALIPGDRPGRPDDRALVALAREQHRVAGSRALQGGRDGLPTIGDDEEALAANGPGGLGPGRDRRIDGVAILVARILVRDDDQPAAFGGDPAHLRTLGRVALPGRAEDRDEAAAPGLRRRSQAVEDGLQRGRAVGVVHDHRERLAKLDAFHPTRHALDGLEAGADRARVEPEGLTERQDGERVVDVESAAQCEPDRAAATGCVVGEREASVVLVHPRRTNLSGGLESVGDDRRPGQGRGTHEPLGGWVVSIHDGRLGPSLRRVRCGDPQALEQRQLGVPVGRPRAVEFEVFVGHVGQDRNVVGDRPDPVEGQSVRGRLDHRGGIATHQHRAEGSLEDRRIRRRGVLLVRLVHASHPQAGRSQHPGPDPGRLERGDREVRGGRLAVRAGDPDRQEVVTGIAVPPGGRGRQGALGGGHHHLGKARARHGPFHEGRRGPTLVRSRDVVVSVRMRPRDGHEQRARHDRPRVVGDATDRDLGRRPHDAQSIQQRAQRQGLAGLGVAEQLGDRLPGHQWFIGAGVAGGASPLGPPRTRARR